MNLNNISSLTSGVSPTYPYQLGATPIEQVQKQVIQEQEIQEQEIQEQEIQEQAIQEQAIQEQAKQLEPIDTYSISLDETILPSPVSESEMSQVANIIAKLRIDFDPMERDLLELECQYFSAQKDLPATEPLVTILITKVKELFRLLHAAVRPMTFDFLASLPISDSFRCVTWLDGMPILPPFVTCIVEKKMHVMMFNMRKAFCSQQMILKVVIGNNLCDVPCTFTPKNVSSTMIVVVVPQIEVQDEQPKLVATKVFFFLDHSLVSIEAASAACLD